MARIMVYMGPPDIGVPGTCFRLETTLKTLNLGQEDYHLVAVDLRGFGDSQIPPDTRSSATFGDHIGDWEAILKSLGVESAVCVG